MIRLPVAAALTAALLTAGVAQADVCETFTRHYERVYGIPAHLLTAMAWAETGRADAAGSVRAWPWTVDSPEGAERYSSKWRAIEAVRDLQVRGETRIAVGCMRVDLDRHPFAFRTLDLAFDPESNVAFAADQFRRLHRRTGDWRAAVALYHSADADVGQDFRARVEALLAEARFAFGGESWAGDPDWTSSAEIWQQARSWVDAHRESPAWAQPGSPAWWHRPAWHRWTAWRGSRSVATPTWAVSGAWRPVGTSRFD
jgi:hypothetical protein